MSDLRFEWDEKKSAANARKHGVSFDEASTAFYDDHGLVIGDPDHSENEDRFVLIRFSSGLRLLVVCHCYRADGDVIRLVSARKARRGERAQYGERYER